MDELTKSQQHEERMKVLYENHGWKLNTPPNLLPPEDKSNFGGGLKCFKMVYDRDETGGKLETMHRCGNPAAKGSFFCAKKHGGGGHPQASGFQANKMELRDGVIVFS